MATGYTHGLTAETPLRSFALDCARAFGALIHMRDDDSDTPLVLPEASNYHEKQLVSANKWLAKLKKMAPAECEAKAAKEYEEALASHRKGWAEMQASRAVYQRLISDTEAWQPPTSEHIGLKKFMLEQLRESDKWDNGSLDRPEQLPIQLSGREWLEIKLSAARRSVAYHAEEDRKEHERTAERRQWILDLQASLPTV